VAAAVEGVDGLEASRLEIDRGGVSYTADTLAELERLHSGAELFTIVGSDAAAELLTWERYDEVARRSRLVVVERPGSDLVLPREVSWLRVVVPHLDVSSTDLRARVVDGRPLDYLVPEDVLSEIRRRRMYEAAEPARAQGRP